MEQSVARGYELADFVCIAYRGCGTYAGNRIRIKNDGAVKKPRFAMSGKMHFGAMFYEAGFM